MTSWQSLSTFVPSSTALRCSKTPSCPFIHIIFPSLLLSPMPSCSINCSLSNCLGETRWAGDLPIPSQLPFLYCSEKLFIRANQYPDTTVDLFICYVVLLSDVKNPSLASSFQGLNSSLQLCCQCPCLASKQINWDDKWTHVKSLPEVRWFCLSKSVQALKVQLLFVQFESGLLVLLNRKHSHCWTRLLPIRYFCAFSLSWIMCVSRAKESLVELIPPKACWPQPRTMHPYGLPWPWTCGSLFHLNFIRPGRWLHHEDISPVMSY